MGLRDLSFDQHVQFTAAKLRGAYLDMCCDIEFALVDITVVCLVKDNSERESVKATLLENAYMSKKITMAETSLKKYNPVYYETYKDCFNQFRELTGWRNKFAHSRIKGDPEEKDLSFVIFQYIKDGEMIERKEYVDPLYTKLMEFASFIYKLVELIPVLYTEQHLAHQNKQQDGSSNISNMF